MSDLDILEAKINAAILSASSFKPKSSRKIRSESTASKRSESSVKPKVKSKSTKNSLPNEDDLGVRNELYNTIVPPSVNLNNTTGDTSIIDVAASTGDTRGLSTKLHFDEIADDSLENVELTRSIEEMPESSLSSDNHVTEVQKIEISDNFVRESDKDVVNMDLMSGSVEVSVLPPNAPDTKSAFSLPIVLNEVPTKVEPSEVVVSSVSTGSFVQSDLSSNAEISSSSPHVASSNVLTSEIISTSMESISNAFDALVSSSLDEDEKTSTPVRSSNTESKENDDSSVDSTPVKAFDLSLSIKPAEPSPVNRSSVTDVSSVTVSVPLPEVTVVESVELVPPSADVPLPAAVVPPRRPNIVRPSLPIVKAFGSSDTSFRSADENPTTSSTLAAAAASLAQKKSQIVASGAALASRRAEQQKTTSSTPSGFVNSLDTSFTRTPDRKSSFSMRTSVRMPPSNLNSSHEEPEAVRRSRSPMITPESRLLRPTQSFAAAAIQPVSVQPSKPVRLPSRSVCPPGVDSHSIVSSITSGVSTLSAEERKEKGSKARSKSVGPSERLYNASYISSRRNNVPPALPPASYSPNSGHSREWVDPSSSTVLTRDAPVSNVEHNSTINRTLTRGRPLSVAPSFQNDFNKTYSSGISVPLKGIRSSIVRNPLRSSSKTREEIDARERALAAQRGELVGQRVAMRARARGLSVDAVISKAGGRLYASALAQQERLRQLRAQPPPGCSFAPSTNRRSSTQSLSESLSRVLLSSGLVPASATAAAEKKGQDASIAPANGNGLFADASQVKAGEEMEKSRLSVKDLDSSQSKVSKLPFYILNAQIAGSSPQSRHSHATRSQSVESKSILDRSLREAQSRHSLLYLEASVRAMHQRERTRAITQQEGTYAPQINPYSRNMSQAARARANAEALSSSLRRSAAQYGLELPEDPLGTAAVMNIEGKGGEATGARLYALHALQKSKKEVNAIIQASAEASFQPQLNPVSLAIADMAEQLGVQRRPLYHLNNFHDIMERINGGAQTASVSSTRDSVNGPESFKASDTTPLYAGNSRTRHSLEQAIREKLRREQQDCTFHPEIKATVGIGKNARPVEIPISAEGVPIPVHERLLHREQLKQAKLEQLSLLREAETMKDVTFQPNVHSSGAVSDGAGADSHNFTVPSREINAQSGLAASNRLYADAKDAARRLASKRAELEALQNSRNLSSVTFHPRVSAHSEKLAAAVRQRALANASHVLGESNILVGSSVRNTGDSTTEEMKAPSVPISEDEIAAEMHRQAFSDAMASIHGPSTTSNQGHKSSESVDGLSELLGSVSVSLPGGDGESMEGEFRRTLKPNHPNKDEFVGLDLNSRPLSIRKEGPNLAQFTLRPSGGAAPPRLNSLVLTTPINVHHVLTSPPVSHDANGSAAESSSEVGDNFTVSLSLSDPRVLEALLTPSSNSVSGNRDYTSPLNGYLIHTALEFEKSRARCVQEAVKGALDVLATAPSGAYTSAQRQSAAEKAVEQALKGIKAAKAAALVRAVGTKPLQTNSQLFFRQIAEQAQGHNHNHIGMSTDGEAVGGGFGTPAAVRVAKATSQMWNLLYSHQQSPPELANLSNEIYRRIELRSADFAPRHLANNVAVVVPFMRIVCGLSPDPLTDPEIVERLRSLAIASQPLTDAVAEGKPTPPLAAFDLWTHLSREKKNTALLEELKLRIEFANCTFQPNSGKYTFHAAKMGGVPDAAAVERARRRENALASQKNPYSYLDAVEVKENPESKDKPPSLYTKLQPKDNYDGFIRGPGLLATQQSSLSDSLRASSVIPTSDSTTKCPFSESVATGRIQVNLAGISTGDKALSYDRQQSQRARVRASSTSSSKVNNPLVLVDSVRNGKMSREPSFRSRSNSNVSSASSNRLSRTLSRPLLQPLSNFVRVNPDGTRKVEVDANFYALKKSHSGISHRSVGSIGDDGTCVLPLGGNIDSTHLQSELLSTSNVEIQINDLNNDSQYIPHSAGENDNRDYHSITDPSSNNVYSSLDVIFHKSENRESSVPPNSSMPSTVPLSRTCESLPNTDNLSFHKQNISMIEGDEFSPNNRITAPDIASLNSSINHTSSQRSDAIASPVESIKNMEITGYESLGDEEGD